MRRRARCTCRRSKALRRPRVSRTAVSSERQSVTSVRSAQSCAVSVRASAGPPMVAVWNTASRRRVIAVRWNTGLRFTRRSSRGIRRRDPRARRGRPEVAFEHVFGVRRTRRSWLTHFTIGSGALRSDATRPASSAGMRMWPPRGRSGASRPRRRWAALRRASRAPDRSRAGRRATRSIPASRRPRSISRRMPTFTQPLSRSTVKSVDAETYGAPSSPCCRCTGKA